MNISLMMACTVRSALGVHMQTTSLHGWHLQDDLDVHAKGSSQYAHLQQLLETARQQVQALQGDLADSNAVVIRSVTGTPAATVQQEAQQLRQQNAEKKRKVDAVYAERAGEADMACPICL